MDEVMKVIAQAEADVLESFLKAVLRRYAEVYPEWEVHLLSLQKGNDRSEQINRVIDILQKMKTSP